ncbi:MAG: LysR family transcriptional regulator [Oscillospiraceae bacterium]
MMEVDISRYEAVLKTVELGNITRAADALGYTQSAVSRIIADLEREWQVSLLTRNRTGVVLTSAGETLLPHLRAICNAQRDLEEQVGELHGLTGGTLRLGTFSSISIHWLPGMMKSFLSLYPNIRFELYNSMEYADIESWIMKGEVDCGFIGLPAVQPIETIFLRRDRLLAVLPADHPLAGAASYPIARFADEPFIQLDDDRDREYARILEQFGVHPTAKYRVNDDYVIIAMVQEGLGVSCLPELVLKEAGDSIVTLPLDTPQFRDIGIAVKRKASTSPVTARFLRHAQEWMEAYQDED